MKEVDWSHRGAYIATRSSRQSGEFDVLPVWADEAVNDPDSVWFDPDPASKSGSSIRVIGYSAGAGCILVVILVPKDQPMFGDYWGVNAWAANSSHKSKYREEDDDGRGGL